MKKFIVETYYTCTFKTVHTLDSLNDQELSKIPITSSRDRINNGPSLDWPFHAPFSNTNTGRIQIP